MPVLEVIERTTMKVESEPPGEIGALMACTPADPFLIAHDCLNPSGHHFIADCSDVVCIHCARIIWA